MRGITPSRSTTNPTLTSKVFNFTNFDTRYRPILLEGSGPDNGLFEPPLSTNILQGAC